MLNNWCFAYLGRCFLTLAAWGQPTPPVLSSTIDRGGYFIIPPAALKPGVVGIVYQLRSWPKVTKANIPIELFWNSACTDGQYRVTITPEQIYFSDGHENPNPSRLYWTFDITRRHYETIKRSLTRQRLTGFLDLSKEAAGVTLLYKSTARDLPSFPEKWTAEQYTAYCDSERSRHLAAIFNVLNTALGTTESPLRQPPKDTPRLFSNREEEILDWLPRPSVKQ